MQELLFLFFLALAYRFRLSFVKVRSHPSLRVLTEDQILYLTVESFYPRSISVSLLLD